MSGLEHCSVRVILLNPENKLLLMHAGDPSTTTVEGKYNGDFWFLLGGEKEADETTEQTAIRELWEEAGLKENEFELGPVVWKGEFDLVVSGVLRRMKQEFIVARTNKDLVQLNELTETEKKVIKEIRWFSLDEIKNSKSIIYPILMPEYLPDILKGKYPKEPIVFDIGKNPE